MATRTWVSGVGDDANPCSRTAPCKTFAGAISKTDTKGEISALDPGGFGAVTITKSVTIDGDGTLASILSASTQGIIINAGPNDVIVLRNLSINGGGTGLNGIRYIAGGAVHIERCTIANVTLHGIDVALSAAGQLFVRDTSIHTCGLNGVNLTATGDIVKASFDRVRIEQCTNFGLHAASGSQVAMTNSILAGNGAGLVVELTAPAAPTVNIDGCRVSGNTAFGIRAVGAVVVRLSRNVVISNGTGLASTTGGVSTLISVGNNVVTGNGTDGAPTSTQLQV